MDWLRSATGRRKFKIEVFGNFILRDNKTKELTNSHGYRPIQDVAALGNGLKEDPDTYHKIKDTEDVVELARSLISGAANSHFRRRGLEESDTKTIVGLVQITLCCDSMGQGQWLQKFASAKIYDVESG